MRYTKWRFQFITRRGLLYSLGLSLKILLLGGVGFWLAFTTAATVGYGDIVPNTHASRTFAVLVVLLGLAVLSLVTASVAAIFVGKEERNIERELMNEIRALRAEVAALHRLQQTVWASRHSAKD